MTTVTEERTQRRDEFVGLLHQTLVDTFWSDAKVVRSGNWLTVSYPDIAFNIVVSTKREAT